MKLNIFDYEDYRLYLKAKLADEDSRLTGARKRLLLATAMSSSLLTQIFSENKQLSAEQGYEVALHFGLTDVEIDYLLLLIELGRAGTEKLKARFRQKLKKMQMNAQTVAAKVSPRFILNEEQKVIYYSNWLYSAIRNLIPTEQCVSLKDFSLKLNVPIEKVESTIQFLIDHGLIKKTESGFSYLPGYTHLESNHPMIFRHHQNWRQRAIQRMDHYTEEHLHYTCPMAVSKKGAKLIRARLLEEIKNLNATLKDNSDLSYCLNIDFFEY